MPCEGAVLGFGDTKWRELWGVGWNGRERAASASEEAGIGELVVTHHADIAAAGKTSFEIFGGRNTKSCTPDRHTSWLRWVR